MFERPYVDKKNFFNLRTLFAKTIYCPYHGDIIVTYLAITITGQTIQQSCRMFFSFL